MTLIMSLATFLIGFSIFSIGFLFGYKKEDRKFLNKIKYDSFKNIQQTDKEKKAKKEWKKFLEYDGSVPND